MTLSKKAIEEFQEIYQKDYGINLDFQEAENIGLGFLVQMSALYKQIPKDYFIKNEKRL